MKVFAICHKEAPVAQAPYLLPLYVGGNGGSPTPSGLRDDMGENIAHKNKNYAELTGLYWIWKNVDDDILGLCHYRRFYSPFMTPYANGIIWAPKAMAQDVVSVDPIGNIFKCEMSFADIIVPIPVQFDRSLEQQYYFHHRAEDWLAAMEAIAFLYPNEGEPAKRFFAESRLFYGYNMFIAKRDVFRLYCAWLFPLLEEMEGRITPSEDPAQNRVYGYLGERLFSWWLHSRKPRSIERPVVICQN